MSDKPSEYSGSDNASHIAIAGNGINGSGIDGNDDNCANSDGSISRHADRDSLFLTANLKFRDGGEEGQVRVRNLSEGGLMAEAAIQATRGMALGIELKNIGWISGKVAWIADRKLGIAFDHPIDPKIVRKPAAKTKDDVPHYLRKLNRHGENFKTIKY